MNGIVKEDLEAIIKTLGEEARLLEGRTLLISGGAGFLGTYFIGVIHLLNKNIFKKPCKVISVDNYITGQKNNFLENLNDPNIRFIKKDIIRPLKIKEPVDYIVHMAGIASPFYFKKYPLETIEVAVTGTKNLLEFARTKKIKGLLVFSSSEIYGDPDPKRIPIPEHYRGNVASIGPRACYDESKRLAETLATTYHQLYGIPVKIVRPFNVYGPGMKPNDYRVIPSFINRGLDGQVLHVHGKGNQTRTFCYITDAITGFFKVLLSGKEGEVYNVGITKGEMNMASLANMVKDLLGKKGIKVKLIDYPNSYPADEPNRRCPDITKIRKELGYNPSIDPRTGLRRTINWYKEVFNK